MSQQEQLQAIKDGAAKSGNPGLIKVTEALEKHKAEFDPSQTIQPGDKLPAFRLRDATNQEVSSADLVARGPLLITFYRGGWCPYCNIAVQHLQRRLDDFGAHNVTLVAITPESPDYSLTTVEKNELKFPVLTDAHNQLARKLGIVYDQSSARDLHKDFGVDLKARNGEDTWEVPIPASILVDRSGVVRNVHVEVDFRERLDPAVALQWAESLSREAN